MGCKKRNKGIYNLVRIELFSAIKQKRRSPIAETIFVFNKPVSYSQCGIHPSLEVSLFGQIEIYTAGSVSRSDDRDYDASWPRHWVKYRLTSLSRPAWPGLTLLCAARRPLPPHPPPNRRSALILVNRIFKKPLYLRQFFHFIFFTTTNTHTYIVTYIRDFSCQVTQTKVCGRT